MTNCYLSFQIGFEKKTVYRLQGPTTIGRGSDNTITVPVPSVSRNHAKVTLKGETWVVEDLKSANGIVIDGKRVDKFTLRCNDTFKLGEVEFSFIEKESSADSHKLTDTVEILSASAADLDILAEKEKEVFWTERLQDVLSAIPFFSFLDTVERNKLTDAATLHGFKAGEMIIREGDPGRSIYVVLNGRVKVFLRDYHGSELELNILSKSEFFGEISLLTGKPRIASVAAIDSTMVMELNYDSMRKLVRENPAVKDVLLEYYVNRLEKIKKKRSEIGMDERRRDPRVNEQLPVLIVMMPKTTPSEQVKSRSWKGESVDISKNGILVKVQKAEPEEFQLNDQVLLEIDFEADLGNIRTAGIVRRAMLYEMEKKTTFVGIKFLGMTDSDSKKLSNFLCGEALA
jgi:CRP-like cAMP-binding protein